MTNQARAAELPSTGILPPQHISAKEQNPDTASQAAATAIQERTSSLPNRDDRVYLVVVVIMGTIGVIAVLGAILLVWIPDKTVPDILMALGSAAVGALGGLLAPSPKTNTR